MEKERNWTEIIKNQQTSGMNVKQYCKKPGMTTSTFYRHKQLLPKTTDSGEAFSEVTIESPKENISMAIDGHLVEFDASLINMVIGALK